MLLVGCLFNLHRFCGWCADDHLRFQLTVGQYTHDMPNSRALYMDMLQRLFPEKNRQELVSSLSKFDDVCKMKLEGIDYKGCYSRHRPTEST